MRSAPRALPERTWWIEPGRLMGGAYPGDLDPRIARDKVAALLDVGIRAFVNLMEERESNRDGAAFAPYAPIAAELARERELQIECARFPIVDQRIPSVAGMRAILAFIDARLALDRPCFVHCWGGRGRTGTVAGIHLIRIGRATRESFEATIRELRGADAMRGSAPENELQRGFVRRYPFDDA
ncbi:MAG: protein phosphatase [Deltaproteobacteria bacterium]|nr:protein phosphatase [Deltaproteobacteria bacterium]